MIVKIELVKGGPLSGANLPHEFVPGVQYAYEDSDPMVAEARTNGRFKVYEPEPEVSSEASGGKSSKQLKEK